MFEFLYDLFGELVKSFVDRAVPRPPVQKPHPRSWYEPKYQLIYWGAVALFFVGFVAGPLFVAPLLPLPVLLALDPSSVRSAAGSVLLGLAVTGLYLLVVAATVRGYKFHDFLDYCELVTRQRTRTTYWCIALVTIAAVVGVIYGP